MQASLIKYLIKINYLPKKRHLKIKLKIKIESIKRQKKI